MKSKLIFGVLTLAILGFTIQSCTKEEVKNSTKNTLKSTETVDPTIGLNLAFHPTIDDVPPAIKIKIKLKFYLWEKRDKKFCNYFGICGAAKMEQNDGQFPQNFIGRDDIFAYVTQQDIDLGYIKIYQMQDVSFLPLQYQSFNVVEDMDLGDGFILKQGSYPLDLTIGQHGGYKINFEYVN
jgi:hypothetical protein